MPGMTGDEVAGIIRKREREIGAEPIPLLAMSAYSDEELRAKYPDAGFSEFVCKPVSRQVLIEMLARFLPGLWAMGWFFIVWVSQLYGGAVPG